MQLSSQLGELTYCTNRHPGATWSEVLTHLQNTAPEVKRAVAPEAPFGLGLGLSAAAAQQLSSAPQLNAFRDFLQRHDLYVFTLNGVHARAPLPPGAAPPLDCPDWRSEEHLRHGNQLAELLAELLPNRQARGTLTTMASSIQPEPADSSTHEQIRDRLIRHAAFLYRLEEHRGHSIALALEPEPLCFLETVEETIRFFKEWLFSDQSVAQFASLTGASRGWSLDLLRRHLGICLDASHAAVTYETPSALLAALREAGVEIKKLQLAAGLRIPDIHRIDLDSLAPYRDPNHRHQVVARHPNGTFTHYPDLSLALADFAQRSTGPSSQPEEWRLLYHLPIGIPQLAPFETTHPFLDALLEAHRTSPLTEHLEVETRPYPARPSPDTLATESTAAIIRELKWAKEALCVT